MIHHRKQTTTPGTVKATHNRPNIMYTVEKLGTVPDEEVEKREKLMHHLFGEAICYLNNNVTIQAINVQTVCMYLQVIMPS